jgi:hypothetical protein
VRPREISTPRVDVNFSNPPIFVIAFLHTSFSSATKEVTPAKVNRPEESNKGASTSETGVTADTVTSITANPR